MRHSVKVWGRRTGFTNTQIRGLSVECQFLLCLMILRRDKTYEECSILFGVSETLISQIFKTWLAFLHFKFQALHEYVQSLTLQDLPKPPKAFRNKLLRKTRYVHHFKVETIAQRCVLPVSFPVDLLLP